MILVLSASIVGLLVLSAPVVKRRLDIFEPLTYFIFAYILGGITETIVFFLDYNITDLPHGLTYDSLVKTQVYSLVGLVSLQFGYSSKLSTRLSRKIPSIKNSAVSSKRLWVISALFYFVGILFLSALLFSIDIKNVDLFSISSKRSVTNGYVLWGAKLIGISGVLGLALGMLERNKLYHIKSLFTLLTILTYFSYCFVFSSRGQFLTIIIIYFIIYRFIYKNYKLHNLIFVLLGLSLLFGFMGVIRGPRRLLIGGFWGATLNTITEKLFGLSSFYDITTFSLIVEKVPRELNYQWGSTLINWLLFPIPRSYWPEKPINLGQRIGAELYGQGIGTVGAGVPPSFISELFLNFHVIGVVIGMFFFGVISKALYKFVLSNQRRLFSVVLYAIIARYLFVLFTGDLTKTMVGLLQWLLPILISFVISSGRLPSTWSR